MFFVLSKLLDVLLSPLTWGLLLVLAGQGRARSPRALRIVRALPWAGLAVLYIFSLEPVGNALWRSLEVPVLDTAKAGEGYYDAVVVLGGLVDEAAMKTFGQPSYNDNIERLLAGRDVMSANRARFVLLSGGSWDEAGTAEAAVLGRQLEAWGVARDRIVVEGRSRNTRENAIESAKIIAERGWKRVLLVTSAFHMRRALGCFRAVGLDPDVMSVDFRSCNCPLSWGQLLPRSSALEESTAALRERFGRLVYRARGYAAAVP